ncbi:MAG: exodeoxyribonuclease VII large subunit [Clostridia bacterium]|nr:exodeoxyribonuclease VII large subunit [Clostridia bacterium]
MTQDVRALTVTQLNTYIQELLAGSPALNRVTLRGEISNLRSYSSGHLYFTLKDEASSIPATMFNGARILNFRPEDGMKVLCTGRVSVYVRDGQYRFYANTLQPDGLGSLAEAFRKLKEKLEKEGLIDPSRRKPIPAYPFRVGLITAPNGAAVRDLISVIQRRFPAAEILLAPSTVQGPNAPAELIRALRLLDGNRLCDVIIIGRGGGSAEDLWCFNDETLARAVFACRTPVISAVGHETDFTICDYVADLRAPTPSAAAEKAVPVQADIQNSLKRSAVRMDALFSGAVRHLSDRVRMLSSRPVLTSPYHLFDARQQRLDMLEGRLTAAVSQGLRARSDRTRSLSTRLALADPKHYLEHQKQKLLLLEGRFSSTVSRSLERKGQTVASREDRLRSLNPLSVLNRGFALAVGEDGSVLRSAGDLPEGARFHLRMADGSVRAVSEGPIQKQQGD